MAQPVTAQDVEALAASMVAELAAPGSFVARNFAQINLAESLCIKARAYFQRVAPNAPELAALEVVAPLYAKRFPQSP